MTKFDEDYNPKEAKCAFCEKTYSNRQNMLRHVKQKHQAREESKLSVAHLATATYSEYENLVRECLSGEDHIICESSSSWKRKASQDSSSNDYEHVNSSSGSNEYEHVKRRKVTTEEVFFEDFNEALPILSGDDVVQVIKHRSEEEEGSQLQLLTTTITDLFKKYNETQDTMAKWIKTIGTESIYFPSFDPDVEDADVNEWVDYITKTKEKFNMMDHDVCIRAASVMKGKAKEWSDLCLIKSNNNWGEMKTLLVEKFSTSYFSKVLGYRKYVTAAVEKIRCRCLLYL